MKQRFNNTQSPSVVEGTEKISTNLENWVPFRCFRLWKQRNGRPYRPLPYKRPSSL